MRIDELAGAAPVAILGLGREGRAAVRAIRAHDPDLPLTVFDEGAPTPHDQNDPRSDDPNLTIINAPLDGAALARFGVLIRSPGVSPYRSELREASKAGVRITTPTSIWLHELPRTNPNARLACVTGTKGKSTTSSLLHSILTHAGVRSLLRGNIGAPVLDHPPSDETTDVFVLELSSAQLADLTPPNGALPPGTIGALLNLFPAHLDFHPDVETYFRDKRRLLTLIRDGVRLINPHEAPVVERTEGLRLAHFNHAEGVHVRDGWFCDAERRLLRTDALALPGEHNLINACCAIAMALELGVAPDALEAGVRAFEPLPHRLQSVALEPPSSPGRSGVRYVNDSISTTPQAARAALRAFADVPVAVLLGGKDVGVAWESLADAILDRDRPVALITLADNGPAIASLVRRRAADRAIAPPSVLHASSVEHAVGLARAALPEGGVVLLSPGAPSQPVFRDFIERGERFARAARAIASGVGGPSSAR